MKTETFVFRSQLPVPAEEAFAWHERAGAFRRLTPPWEPVELLSPDEGIREGSRATLRVKVGPISRLWIAEHRRFEPGRQFQDVQIEGPFAVWEHTHTIRQEAESACVLEDSIRYAPPFGPAGRWLGGRLIRRKLERMFAYRHRVTHDDLRSLHAAREKAPMKVLVSGSTGLLGSALVSFLKTGGHQVVRLVRSQSRAPEEPHIVWDSEIGRIDPARLEGIDALVHLAGEGIAKKRWTPEQKKRIRDSRVIPTRGLSEALANCANPPRAFVCASAIGYYGDRGDEVLVESSGPGTGFLAELCQDWEAACQPARDKGIRTVNLRTGVVLSQEGGALRSMLTPFRMGVGGVMGSGRQYWSWVALDDVVDAIHFALTNETVSGPVNVTAPNPVTNREFTKTLGRVLKRPTIFPMPAFAARLAFGEMADDLILGSNRILPAKLQEHGYRFRFPELEPALRHLLGKG